MAQKAKAYAVSALKAITYRIASTPTEQLPRCVAQLAASIWTCRDVLTTPNDALKQDSDLSVIVHRFKTQLSTLLSDRTVEGRWAAIVLVKATVEAGGVEVLSKSNAWVRALLGILKKPDPPTTRALAVLTLTRIFMLTWDYSNLVREITTPALPTFVSTCLSNAENVRCSSHELQSILEAFETLLPHHPTIFRSNETALRSLLLRVISSSAAAQGPCFSTQHVATAQQLLVLLPHCVPKQGGSEKWDEDFQNVIRAAHQTCDLVFAPVIETWKSSIEAYRSHGGNKVVTTRVEQDTVDAAGLGSWSGILAGAERMNTLLDLATSYLEFASPSAVSIRIGMLLDLASRVAFVTISGSGPRSTLQTNPQTVKEERDALFSILPSIHAHLLDLLTAAVDRLGVVMLPTLSNMIESLINIFAAESFDPKLRAASYRLLRTVIEHIGSTLGKEEIADLPKIMSACCNDLEVDITQDASKHSDTQANGDKNKLQANDLVIGTGKTRSSRHTSFFDLHNEAVLLLSALLSRLRAFEMPRRSRIQLDRTAVLSRNKDALLASVLNPAPSPSGHGLQISPLPILARMFPSQPEVEALLRPRMPFVHRSVDIPQDSISEGEPLDESDESEVEPSDAGDMSQTVEDKEVPAYTPGSQGKRSLEVADITEDVLAKRQKEDTASSQIQSEWQAALATASASERPMVIEPVVNVPAKTASTLAIDVAEDEDESDFEMPPLTMEQDTEDDDDD